jgi:hypothetical protein
MHYPSLKGKPMYVDLRTLRPNPMRDFHIDPIDLEAVARLKQSIEDDGFWGGVVCRQLPDGTLQIGAGHHRVRAALEAGITEADVFVAEEMDDATMVRVYARENATQRGATSTAMTGTVAAAMRYVAKVILLGRADKFVSSFHLPTLRERLLSDDGIGRDVLLAFLVDIPGINVASLRQQLANIKTSGDYARLIAVVEVDIAREHPDALEAIEAARQAARKAAQQPKTFDYEGVVKYLKIPYQLEVFREEVTQEAVQKLLPVDQQAALAARLVSLADEEGWYVSGEFIRRTMRRIREDEQSDFMAFIRREQARQEEESEAYALERTFDRLQRHVRGLERAGRRIAKMLEAWPADQVVPPIDYELRADIYHAHQALTQLLHDQRFAYEPDQHVPPSQPQSRRQIPRNGTNLVGAVSA